MSGRHRSATASRRGRHRRPASRRRLVVPALTATVVLAGGGTAIGLTVGGASPGATVTPHASPFGPSASVSTAPLVDPTPSVAVTTPTLTPTLAPHKPAHRATATRPRPTDTLALRVTGSQSYIQITSRSGHLLIRRILHHGQHLAYRRHGLDVVIGNAGAVRLSVGGHRAHLAGRPGQVRRLHVH